MIRPGGRDRGEAFQEAVDFSGVILSKLDGDARGGAALSVARSRKADQFASIGEKLDEFEAFHPDRMAGRISAWATC